MAPQPFLQMMSSLNDLLFKNKNHSYGAYLLRKQQPRIMNVSMILGVLIFIFVFGGMLVYYGLPEDMNQDEWIEYDHSVIGNPYQTDIMLKEPPGGYKKKQESATDVGKDPDPADFLIADNTNKDGDSTGTGNDSIGGNGLGTNDSTVGTAINISKDPSIVYKMTTMLDEPPMFPGGENARGNYFRSNIKYPKFAIDNRIQGIVYINFIVERDSSISNIQILQGIGSGCDEEAIRVAGIMPKWIPGRKGGSAVRVLVTMPLAFTLASQK